MDCKLTLVSRGGSSSCWQCCIELSGMKIALYCSCSFLGSSNFLRSARFLSPCSFRCHLAIYLCKLFRLANTSLRIRVDSHSRSFLHTWTHFSTRKFHFHFFYHSYILLHMRLHLSYASCLFHAAFLKETGLDSRLHSPNSTPHILMGFRTRTGRYINPHWQISLGLRHSFRHFNLNSQ
jgi:hypothetical protein